MGSRSEDSFLVPRKVRSARLQGKGTRAHLKKTRLQVRTLPELSEKLPPTRSARVWLGLKGGTLVGWYVGEAK